MPKKELFSSFVTRSCPRGPAAQDWSATHHGVTASIGSGPSGSSICSIQRVCG